MDKQQAIERAQNALAIAEPLAAQVDWYINEHGEIDALHQTEPIDPMERMAVIMTVLARDVLALAREGEG